MDAPRNMKMKNWAVFNLKAEAGEASISGKIMNMRD